MNRREVFRLLTGALGGLALPEFAVASAHKPDRSVWVYAHQLLEMETYIWFPPTVPGVFLPNRFVVNNRSYVLVVEYSGKKLVIPPFTTQSFANQHCSLNGGPKHSLWVRSWDRPIIAKDYRRLLA